MANPQNAIRSTDWEHDEFEHDCGRPHWAERKAAALAELQHLMAVEYGDLPYIVVESPTYYRPGAHSQVVHELHAIAIFTDCYSTKAG